MNRTFVRITTAAAAVSAAALFFPAVASADPVSSAECAEISTGTQPNGWGNTFSDESGQAGTHSAVKVVDQDGSLALTIAEGKNRAASYHAADGLELKNLNGPLTFEKTAGNANWQIRVTGANTLNTSDTSGFATFVWGAADGTGKQDATESDQWWATRDLPGYSKGATATLDELTAAANSDGHSTVVNHYGISSQPASGGGTVNVDNVSFNGCATNFKASGSSEEDGGAFGSLGGLGLGSLIP